MIMVTIDGGTAATETAARCYDELSTHVCLSVCASLLHQHYRHLLLLLRCLLSNEMKFNWKIASADVLFRSNLLGFFHSLCIVSPFLYFLL